MCEIEPFVVFGPGVTVQSGARHPQPFASGRRRRSRRGAIIGPFARLRPGAKIGEDAHIGNFVEVKNSAIEKGAKANHLTYLGDAQGRARAPISAPAPSPATMTASPSTDTEIGAGAFIGSNTALVAPVKIGDGAITGAGSVITKDVAADALAVARGKQIENPGWAKAFRERQKAKKQRRRSNVRHRRHRGHARRGARHPGSAEAPGISRL